MKDQDREEARRQFKEMKGKKKAAYIFQYYWPHMIIAAVCIGLAIYIIGKFTFNKDKPISLGIVVETESPITPDPVEDLADKLSEKYPDLCQDGEALIEVYPYYMHYEEGSTDDVLTAYKFLAQVAAQQVDIFIGDKESLLKHASDGYITSLGEYFTEEELAELEEKANALSSDGSSGMIRQDYVVTDVSGNEMSRTEDVPCLLCICGADSDIDACYSEGNQDIYLGIVVNSSHEEAAKQMVYDLFDMEAPQ